MGEMELALSYICMPMSVDSLHTHLCKYQQKEPCPDLRDSLYLEATAYSVTCFVCIAQMIMLSHRSPLRTSDIHPTLTTAHTF